MATYRIVPERSTISLQARSSLHPIHGKAAGLEGFVDVEVQGGGRINLTVAPKGRVEMAVDLLKSGNALEDREMLRRIDARKFPLIVGELTELVELPSEGAYHASGALTFHGVTRTVDGDLAISQDGDGRLHVTGEQEFDIRDFGVQPPRILTLKVHPEVRVRLDAVAERVG